MDQLSSLFNKYRNQLQARVTNHCDRSTLPVTFTADMFSSLLVIHLHVVIESFGMLLSIQEYINCKFATVSRQYYLRQKLQLSMSCLILKGCDQKNNTAAISMAVYSAYSPQT